MSDSTHALPRELRLQLELMAPGEGRLVVMTGAGISAESGIPTFRGKEGYWTVGSKEYHPRQMATYSMFRQQPHEVWAWYLYRRGVYRGAAPNSGHEAVVRMERLLRDRFLLITQNVDGLHLRAGNSLERTYQIHGNIDYARCAKDCGQPLFALPEALGPRGKDEPLTDDELDATRCPGCGEWARPHVLWFDECYDEEHFRFDSSLRAAVAADLLLVVGTAGATNLPMQVGNAALQHGATLVDINPEPNPFSEMAIKSERGFYLRGGGGQFLPPLADYLGKVLG